MDFKQTVMQRYATKKFDGKQIPQEKVDELLELIRMAPSSFNLQPWKIKVIADQKTKDELLHASFGQAQVTTASHLLVFFADSNVEVLIDKLEAQMKQAGPLSEGAAGYIKMMRGFAAGMSKEQKLAWAQRQVYLALANALNGAKALGFDSCPMEGFNPQEYAKILKAPGHLVPTVVCPIGYQADGGTKPKARFAKEDIFF